MTLSDWTLLLLTGLPLLSGTCLLVALSSFLARRDDTPRLAHYVTLCAAGLVAVSSLLLLPYASDSPTAGSPFAQVEWLPGTGPMAVGLGTTGLYAAWITSWSAFFALLAGPGHNSSDHSPLSGVLILFALAAANAAFLSLHFLGRYVALEITALCVALMPIVELRGANGLHDVMGTNLSTTTYLILRVGDAGLLAAILILMDAGSTLDIASALEAGKTLDAARLDWAVAGFLLAVWIKQGAWPFHLWLHSGRALTLAGRAWLYATVMPNLGIYLLYRITPLLAVSESLRMTTLCLGAGSAVVAMVLACVALGRTDRPDLYGGLIYLGAAQGGLTLLVAANGIKSLVWLVLLLLTLPRLLLFLSADAGERADSRIGHQVAAGAFGVGALFSTVSVLLITWWSRETSIQPGPFLLGEGVFFAAQVVVSLMIIWIVRTVWQLVAHPGTGTWPPGQRESGSSPTRIGWTQWAVIGVLVFCVLVGGLAWKPLIHHLLSASHAPPLPPLSSGHIAAFALSLLTSAGLAAAIWLPGRQKERAAVQHHRQETEKEQTAPSEQAVYGLEEGLAQMARILRNVIEISIQERILVTIVHAVVKSAQWTYQVMETQFLESLLSRAVRVVIRAGHTAYRTVEQKGLEDSLYRIAQGTMALSRHLQRLHTGKLRHNLIWIASSLAIAMLALLFY